MKTKTKKKQIKKVKVEYGFSVTWKGEPKEQERNKLMEYILKNKHVKNITGSIKVDIKQ